jgi:hypothetical protein
MVDALAPSTAPRYVEMNRTFGRERDGGRNLEVAMAATAFRDLQTAGLIPASARLADAPPASGTGTAAGLRGTSYEARLVEMIRDRDGNGRLDLDVDTLRQSGLVSSSATNDQLESAISGAPRERLTDTFINRQASNSGLNSYGVAPSARGRDVQGYSSAMPVQSTQDRQTAAFVADIPRRATAGESRQVADEAILAAQGLNGRRDQRGAQEMLTRTGDALQSAGRFDDARRVYGELRNPPYRDTAVNLVQGSVDQVRRDTGNDFSSRSVAVIPNGGTSNEIDPSRFRSTYGQLADRRIAQMDQHQEMARVTGRTNFDPTNMDHARDYFQHYAQGHTTDQVRGEWQRYQQNFFTHAGQGVTWDPNVPVDQRSARVNELLAGQPRDAAGRTIVDCEGFTYMTRNVLGGIQDAQGRNRFDVVFAERPGHVITGVFDRSSGQAFSVYNNDTAMMEGNFVNAPTTRPRRGAPPPSVADGTATWNEAAVSQAMGRAMAGNTVDIVGLGLTPSAATVTDESGRPRTGAGVWDGNGFRGVVTPQMAEAYCQRVVCVRP